MHWAFVHLSLVWTKINPHPRGLASAIHRTQVVGIFLCPRGDHLPQSQVGLVACEPRWAVEHTTPQHAQSDVEAPSGECCFCLKPHAWWIWGMNQHRLHSARACSLARSGDDGIYPCKSGITELARQKIPCRAVRRRRLRRALKMGLCVDLDWRGDARQERLPVAVNWDTACSASLGTLHPRCGQRRGGPGMGVA